MNFVFFLVVLLLTNNGICLTTSTETINLLNRKSVYVKGRVINALSEVVFLSSKMPLRPTYCTLTPSSRLPLLLHDTTKFFVSPRSPVFLFQRKHYSTEFMKKSFGGAKKYLEITKKDFKDNKEKWKERLHWAVSGISVTVAGASLWNQIDDKQETEVKNFSDKVHNQISESKHNLESLLNLTQHQQNHESLIISKIARKKDSDIIKLFKRNAQRHLEKLTELVMEIKTSKWVRNEKKQEFLKEIDLEQRKLDYHLKLAKCFIHIKSSGSAPSELDQALDILNNDFITSLEDLNLKTLFYNLRASIALTVMVAMKEDNEGYLKLAEQAENDSLESLVCAKDNIDAYINLIRIKKWYVDRYDSFSKIFIPKKEKPTFPKKEELFKEYKEYVTIARNLNENNPFVLSHYAKFHFSEYEHKRVSDLDSTAREAIVSIQRAMELNPDSPQHALDEAFIVLTFNECVVVNLKTLLGWENPLEEMYERAIQALQACEELNHVSSYDRTFPRFVLAKIALEKKEKDCSVAFRQLRALENQLKLSMEGKYGPRNSVVIDLKSLILKKCPKHKKEVL